MISSQGAKGRWAPFIAGALIALLTLLEHTCSQARDPDEVQGIQSSQGAALSRSLPARYFPSADRHCWESRKTRTIACQAYRVSEESWHDDFLPELRRLGWTLEPSGKTADFSVVAEKDGSRLTARYTRRGSVINVSLVYQD